MPKEAGEVDAPVSGSHAGLPNGEHLRLFVLAVEAQNKEAANFGSLVCFYCCCSCCLGLRMLLVLVGEVQINEYQEFELICVSCQYGY